LREERLRAREIPELHHEKCGLVERARAALSVGAALGPAFEQVRERGVIAEAPVVLTEMSERLEIIGVPP